MSEFPLVVLKILLKVFLYPDRLSSLCCSVMLHTFSQWERGTSETLHLWVLFFPSEFHRTINSSFTTNTVLASPTLGNQKVNTQKIYTRNRQMFSSYLLFLSDWVDQNHAYSWTDHLWLCTHYPGERRSYQLLWMNNSMFFSPLSSRFYKVHSSSISFFFQEI